MSDEEKVLLQQVILPVFAAGLDGGLVHLGTCFVICTLGRQALMLSAAHVIRGVLTVDGVRDLHHASTPPEFRVVRSDNNSLRSTRMLVFYRDTLTSGHFAEIDHAFINDPLDVAVCSVSFPEAVPGRVSFSRQLTIDTTPPERRMDVISAGYGDTTLDVNVDRSNEISIASFESKLDYRHGKIVDVFSSSDEARRYGPSFQVDIPISSGMSGGPVINKRYGGRVVACGVNVSDISLEDDSGGSGSGIRAIAQMLWPAMSIVVENVEIDGMQRPVRLLELTKRGFVADLGNSADHIFGVPPPGEKDFRMGWR